MSQYKEAEIGDTVYFWFAANATTGAAGDGATPLYDVRLAGGAAGDAPTASGTPTLLTHANYSDGLHEIAVDTTGYSAGEYAVFCTLTISTVNPAGFCGSFRLKAAGASIHSATTRVLQALPAATAGAAGGVFIAGTNAATTITSAGGSALTLTSTGSNGSGLVATGNGTGKGIIATGGASGAGFAAIGGSTANGYGIYAEANSASCYGIEAIGNGATESGGIKGSATTSGEGIEGIGGGNGHGLYVVGAGTGEGIHATAGAGANAHGAHFEGVGANSSGLVLSRGGAGGDDLNFAFNDVTVATVTTVTNPVTLANGAHGGAATTITLATPIVANTTQIEGGDATDALAAAVDGIATTLGVAGAGLTALGDTRLANLDATVSSRLAPAGTLATVTNLTNPVTLANGAHGGGATVITLQTPIVANATQIEGGDATDALNAATPTVTLADGAHGGGATTITGNITGNLSGSVGSVTGSVGSVSGAVASVTGSVGSVTGAVGSVTAGVTVTTNNDKTGYSLTTAPPTADETADAILDRANGVETSWTLRQALRVILASLAGKLSGAATTTATIRDVGDAKNRIVATVDADGNRTAVTYDKT